MPPINLDEALRARDRRLRAGLEAWVRCGHQLYRDAVTAVTEEPDDNGNFPGPHSQPGEYPHKETGQGEVNIDYGVDRNQDTGGLRARFGVRGEASGFGPFGNHRVAGGQHLVHLSHGRDRLGRLFGRLGMDQIVADNREKLNRAFIEAAQNVD